MGKKGDVMEDQSGLVSFFVVFFMLCVSVFIVIYWYDIDDEENEARERQNYNRVEWSNYQMDKENETDKIA